MLKTLFEIGVSGLVGFLLGLGAVVWIDPKTPGGMFLIILVCVVLAVIIGWIVKRILGVGAAAAPGGHPGDKNQNTK